MSKPIQTLLAAYVDNLVAAESLVEERVPVMDRPAMESRLRDSLFFFAANYFRLFYCQFSINYLTYIEKEKFLAVVIGDG